MLKSMVAVVTGSGHGLGRETFNRFIMEGASVVGCDIVKYQGELTQDTDERFAFVKADVRSEKEVENVISTAMEKFGRLDFLVNCAGIGGAYRVMSPTELKPIKLEDFSRIIEINTLGSFNVSRLAAQEMAKNNPDRNGCRGVIINTSGFAGRNGRQAQSAISASWGGINSMTLPMSRDLAPLGIRVATISPGFFETPLTSSFDKTVKKFLQRVQLFPYRFGHPSEYSDLVIHIIQNSMINGEVLDLDAGLRIPGL